MRHFTGLYIKICIVNYFWMMYFLKIYKNTYFYSEIQKCFYQYFINLKLHLYDMIYKQLQNIRLGGYYEHANCFKRRNH